MRVTGLRLNGKWPTFSHSGLSQRAAPGTLIGDRETVTEHRISAFGLLPRRFVLNDIPVLDENSVLDA
jgi:hypothetical protein